MVLASSCIKYSSRLFPSDGFIKMLFQTATMIWKLLLTQRVVHSCLIGMRMAKIVTQMCVYKNVVHPSFVKKPQSREVTQWGNSHLVCLDVSTRFLIRR